MPTRQNESESGHQDMIVNSFKTLEYDLSIYLR